MAAPTREAHLATLRAWHDSRFRASPVESTVTGASQTEWTADAPTGEIIVAAADSLVAVNPATGEVRT